MCLNEFIDTLCLRDMNSIIAKIYTEGGNTLLYLDAGQRVVAKYEDKIFKILWIRGVVTFTYSHDYFPYAFMSFAYNYARNLHRNVCIEESAIHK